MALVEHILNGACALKKAIILLWLCDLSRDLISHYI